MKRLLLYLIRWQLSTPILAIVVYFLVDKIGSLNSTIIANLVGGLVFYQIDKFIFRKNSK
jgi:uncharacterized membrane-anchored protein